MFMNFKTKPYLQSSRPIKSTFEQTAIFHYLHIFKLLNQVYNIQQLIFFNDPQEIV